MVPAATFLASALGTLALLGACIRWLAPRGWMDHPDPRKQHGRPIPRVGGAAFLGMIGLGHALGRVTLPLNTLEWTAIYGLGILGLLDDRFDLRARWKAVVGLLWAVPLAVATTWALTHDGTGLMIFGLDFPEYAPLIASLLLLWYWAVPHAFNLVDGINGLSIGMMALLCLFTGHGPAAAPFLWGTLTVLFLANYPRAHHFMGDAGALSFGLLGALLAMKAALPLHAGRPLFLLAYPIVDVTMVVTIRALTQQPLGAADRNHLHHWMSDRLGGRTWLATPILLGLAALPMSRNLNGAGSEWIAGGGYLILAGLALLNIRQKVSAHRAELDALVRVRRQVPSLAPSPVREPSGAHRIR